MWLPWFDLFNLKSGTWVRLGFILRGRRKKKDRTYKLLEKKKKKRQKGKRKRRKGDKLKHRYRQQTCFFLRARCQIRQHIFSSLLLRSRVFLVAIICMPQHIHSLSPSFTSYFHACILSINYTSRHPKTN